MKTSTIKSWKYDKNKDFQNDNPIIINEEEDNDASNNNMKKIPNSFRDVSSEEDNEENQKNKDLQNKHLNDDYYSNFLLNLNKQTKEYVTLNKKETKTNKSINNSGIQNPNSKDNNIIKINHYHKQVKTSNEKDDLFFLQRSQSNKNFMRCKFNSDSVKKMFDKVDNMPNHPLNINNDTNVNNKFVSIRKSTGSPYLGKRNSKQSKNDKNKRKSKKKYSIETSPPKVEKSCRNKEIPNKHVITEKDKEEQLHKIKMTNYCQNDFIRSNLSKLKTLHVITGTVVEETKQKDEENIKEVKMNNKEISDNVINNEKIKKKKGFCCLPFICKIKK